MTTPTEYHVFLSCHPDDELPAEEIARRLRGDHALEIWLRAWSLTPGRETQEEREEGLAQSNALLSSPSEDRKTSFEEGPFRETSKAATLMRRAIPAVFDFLQDSMRCGIFVLTF